MSITDTPTRAQGKPAYQPIPHYVRPAIRDVGDNQYEVQSTSRPDRWHLVDMARETCSCEAWARYRRCPHLLDVQAHRAEVRAAVVRQMRVESSVLPLCPCGKARGVIKLDESAPALCPACHYALTAPRCCEAGCENPAQMGSRRCGAHAIWDAFDGGRR